MRRFKIALGAVLATVCIAASAEAPPRFPAAAVWHQDISQAPLHPQSASMIGTLADLGGFGNGRMQIDFGMHIVHAPANAPMRTIIGYPSNGEYYFPDCEPVGTAMPVPLDGAIESSTDLTCDNGGEDCHLLVVQGTTLYEAYRANATGNSGLQSQCLAVWALDQVYPASNRGEHCTSADAAGFPIAPLLFNADEIFAAMQVSGDLGHAIRFILPNARMASDSGTRLYVRPASHAGGPSGPEASVPYGSRLRLRANFPVNLYPPAAQAILRTMQRYGIVLADGGTVALTAESDLFTVHSWDELGIHSRTFDQDVPSAPVRAQDFAVIDTGPRIIETYECVRNPDPGGDTPEISITDVSLTEGNSGNKNATFTIALSQASDSPVSFDVATADGSATAGSDYVAKTQVGRSIPAGDDSTTFSVVVHGDTGVEPDETFSANLTNVDGATVGDGQGIATIVNDDIILPQLTIADVSVTEHRYRPKVATFTVQLSVPAASPVTYSIATGNLTATAGQDYLAKTLTGQVIDTGASSKTFKVFVVGDALPEADETYSVNVTAVTGASTADGYAIGTIVNED